MKLNLDKPLLGLDGEPVLEPNGTPVKMNLMVANVLARSKSDDPVKMLSFAIGLFKEGEIEIDLSDLDKLKDQLSKSELTDLARGQILLAIKGVEAGKK